MTVEPRRFRQGELFEWLVEIGPVRVELLAEIEIPQRRCTYATLPSTPSDPNEHQLVPVPSWALRGMTCFRRCKKLLSAAAHHRDPALGTEARA